ncbi:hypothetical protein PF003_g39861 [Phytophthora fragariae]|nr:hypothetical protein PF003_g39861 [Phytophthora fragariae]
MFQSRFPRWRFSRVRWRRSEGQRSSVALQAASWFLGFSRIQPGASCQASSGSLSPGTGDSSGSAENNSSNPTDLTRDDDLPANDGVVSDDGGHDSADGSGSEASDQSPQKNPTPAVTMTKMTTILPRSLMSSWRLRLYKPSPSPTLPSVGDGKLPPGRGPR